MLRATIASEQELEAAMALADQRGETDFQFDSALVPEVITRDIHGQPLPIGTQIQNHRPVVTWTKPFGDAG